MMIASLPKTTGTKTVTLTMAKRSSVASAGSSKPSEGRKFCFQSDKNKWETSTSFGSNTAIFHGMINEKELCLFMDLSKV